MQIPLDDCLNQVEARNVDIEPEFAKGNHAVPAGLSVRTELVGEGNQCNGRESPSDGADDLKQELMPLSGVQDARFNGIGQGTGSLSSYLRAIEVTSRPRLSLDRLAK